MVGLYNESEFGIRIYVVQRTFYFGTFIACIYTRQLQCNHKFNDNMQCCCTGSRVMSFSLRTIFKMDNHLPVTRTRRLVTQFQKSIIHFPTPELVVTLFQNSIIHFPTPELLVTLFQKSIIHFPRGLITYLCQDQRCSHSKQGRAGSCWGQD